MNEKIQALLKKCTEDSQKYLVFQNLNCKRNLDLAVFKAIEGKKYIKIDTQTSGKFMIDESGNIYGIKAYGVINRLHQFGNLDTIEDYFWGTYTPLLIQEKNREQIQKIRTLEIKERI